MSGKRREVCDNKIKVKTGNGKELNEDNVQSEALCATWHEVDR